MITLDARSQSSEGNEVRRFAAFTELYISKDQIIEFSIQYKDEMKFS